MRLKIMILSYYAMLLEDYTQQNQWDFTQQNHDQAAFKRNLHIYILG